jgi:hypothetical protein
MLSAGELATLSTDTEHWATRLEDRARYLAYQALAILIFVLCLAVLAVAVFFFAASITRSDLSASDIDSKLNATSNAIAKLQKDLNAAVQDVDARAGEVAGQIKDVGERFTELSASKASLMREGGPQAPTMDLSNEPTSLDHLGQIVLANLQNPNPDGSISRSIFFRGHFAVALRSSPEGWRMFVSNMKDFAPLVQALEAYHDAQKKGQDLGQTIDLNRRLTASSTTKNQTRSPDYSAHQKSLNVPQQ